MSLNFILPFKLNLDQVPDDLDLRKIYFAAQTISYYLAKYTGRFTEQPSNYSQLGFENLNTNALRFYAQANGVINTNDLVYFVASGTTVKAAQARANSMTTAAKGVYLGATALGAGDWAEFSLSPTLLITAGLTPGNTYYLSTATAGLFQATRPNVAGQVVQDIGIALSDTTLLCDPSKHTELL
jgi:hypothetical protein